MTRRPALVAILAATALSLTLGAAPASAEPAPAPARASGNPVTVLDPDIDAATEAPAISWKLRRFSPRKAKATLQTRSGGPWTDVTRLREIRGTIALPPVAAGLHEYRIRVVPKRGKGPAHASAPRQLRAYATVPLSGITAAPSSGTVTIGSTAFAYAAKLTTGAVVQILRSSCQSLSVTVGSPTRAFRLLPYGGQAVQVAAGVLQPVQVSARSGQIRLVVSQAGAASSEPFIYANGTGYCWTADGRG